MEKEIQANMEWDRYFLDITTIVATKSKDNSSKYGAVIMRPTTKNIISTGYNGIPRGIKYIDEYHNRPDKYLYFVHAEQNAIFNAAREGVSLEGTTMYVLRPPCAECVRAIIQVGIVEIVFNEPHPPYDHNIDEANWRNSLDIANEMTIESPVRIRIGRG